MTDTVVLFAFFIAEAISSEATAEPPGEFTSIMIAFIAGLLSASSMNPMMSEEDACSENGLSLLTMIGPSTFIMATLPALPESMNKLIAKDKIRLRSTRPTSTFNTIYQGFAFFWSFSAIGTFYELPVFKCNLKYSFRTTRRITARKEEMKVAMHILDLILWESSTLSSL